MRRHRRWLYVFLWLVIAAFIVLYIPAFQDAGAGGAGRGRWPGGRRAHHRRASSSSAYLRQRAAASSGCTRARLDPAMLRAHGPRASRCSQAPGRRAPGARWRRERLGLTVDDETLARAIATLARLPGERPLHGRGGAPPPPGAAGRHRGGVRGVAARAASCASGCEALVTDGVARERPRRPSASSAAATSRCKVEYVLVDAGAVPRRRPRATDARGAGALRGAARGATASPSSACVSYLLVDPRAAAARGSRSPTREIEAYYRRAPRASSSSRRRPAPATSW